MHRFQSRPLTEPRLIRRIRAPTEGSVHPLVFFVNFADPHIYTFDLPATNLVPLFLSLVGPRIQSSLVPSHTP